MYLHPKLDEDFLATSTNSPASASQARKLQLICRLLDDSKLSPNELFRDIYVHAAALRFGPASQPGVAEMAIIGSGWTTTGA